MAFSRVSPGKKETNLLLQDKMETCGETALFQYDSLLLTLLTHRQASSLSGNGKHRPLLVRVRGAVERRQIRACASASGWLHTTVKAPSTQIAGAKKEPPA